MEMLLQKVIVSIALVSSSRSNLDQRYELLKIYLVKNVQLNFLQQGWEINFVECVNYNNFNHLSCMMVLVDANHYNNHIRFHGHQIESIHRNN